MKIWMVTGIHNPQWLSNTLDNYKRQICSNKGLILIENGEGIGVTDGFTLPMGTTILRSDSGPAQPLNAALSWLKYHSPDDWFCKCDSDDYYGPNYLSSIQEAIEVGADYTGRPDMFIKNQSNHLWLAYRNLKGFCGEFANGCTLAAKISKAEYFPEVQYWGEDTLWCSLMKEKGNRFYALAPEGMAYQRWADNRHTWPCTDQEIIAGCSVPIWDFGPWNPDIVNGVVPRPQGVRVEPPPLNLETSMPHRILMENLDSEMQEAINAGPIALGKLMQERSTKSSNLL